MINNLLYFHITSARSNETDYLHSNFHYSEAIKLRCIKLKIEFSKENRSEFYALMSEYLIFKSLHFRQCVYFCRNLHIAALDFLVNARNLSQDEKRIDFLNQNINDLIKQIILNYGCVLPKNNLHYTVKCPIYIRSVLGYEKTSSTLEYKNPMCSICNKKYLKCDHIMDEIYEGKLAKIVADEVEIIDVSVVSNPRIENRIPLVYIPIKWLEDTFSIDEVKERKDVKSYCHLCIREKIDPSEINYNLFIDMQRPEKDLEGKSNESIFMKVFLAKDQSGLNIDKAVGIPFYKYNVNEKFTHFKSFYKGDFVNK